MKHVWQCEDGTIHDHFEGCIGRWLGEMPVMELGSILLALDNDGKDEFYGSERDYGRVFIEKAYEISVANPSLVTFKGRNIVRVQKRS